MSRSGYSDDIHDQWQSIMFRGALNSAIKGARGQHFLRELLSGLDAMPKKELVSGELEIDGQFCSLGVVGQAKGFDLASIDTYDADALSKTFNIASSLAREIMFINDETVTEHEFVYTGLPYPNQRKLMAVANVGEKRWRIVREWVQSNIKSQP